MTDQGLQEFQNGHLCVGLNAAHFDRLRDDGLDFFSRVTMRDELLPLLIGDFQFVENVLFSFGSAAAFLDDRVVLFVVERSEILEVHADDHVGTGEAADFVFANDDVD